MKQYEKATAPRNRNRRNGPGGSARASRNLLRHPDRAGLSWSASGPRRGTAGLCPASVCGPGPEAVLPAGRGRASASVLCSAAGGLLRIPRPWLEASASASWALCALSSSSLTIEFGGTRRSGTRRQTQKKRGIAERGSFSIRAFSLRKLFRRKD